MIEASKPKSSEGEAPGDAVEYPFTPTLEEWVAFGLHVSRPTWEPPPGMGAFVRALLIWLAPTLAAALLIWPLNRLLPGLGAVPLILGGIWSLVLAPGAAAAALARFGGPWAVDVRRGLHTRRLRKTFSDPAWTATERTLLVGPAGVAERVGGSFLFRAWPRLVAVDRVPVLPLRSWRDRLGGEEPEEDLGELLTLTAVSGGPRPVTFFVPQRALESVREFDALVRWAEQAFDATRRSDPADPRWAPPPACRAPPGAPAAEYALEAADHEAVAAALTPQFSLGRRTIRAALAASCVAAGFGAFWLCGMPAFDALFMATVLGFATAVGSLWASRPGGVSSTAGPRAARLAAEADATLTELATTVATAEGVRVAGAGFGAVHPWRPTAPAGTVRVAFEDAETGEEWDEEWEETFLLLFTAVGSAILVPRRAFGSDAAFNEFAAAAEGLRTGPPAEPPLE